MNVVELLFGVRCMVDDKGGLTCSVNEVKNVEFVDSLSDRSMSLAAVFRMSNQSFATAKDMMWTLGKKRGVRYIDLVKIRPDMETQLLYDAIGDMMVESALDMGAMVVRVKLNKGSMLGATLVKNGYTSTGSDGKYSYFEVSVHDYIER